MKSEQQIAQEFAIREVLGFGQNENLKACPEAYVELMTKAVKMLADAFPEQNARVKS